MNDLKTSGSCSGGLREESAHLNWVGDFDVGVVSLFLSEPADVPGNVLEMHIECVL